MKTQYKVKDPANKYPSSPFPKQKQSLPEKDMKPLAG